MAKSKDRQQRKPAQQLPGIHRGQTQRLVPNLEFQVDLTAERREEINELLFVFINAIPNRACVASRQ